jgi:hypothetical protein
MAHWKTLAAWNGRYGVREARMASRTFRHFGLAQKILGTGVTGTDGRYPGHTSLTFGQHGRSGVGLERYSRTSFSLFYFTLRHLDVRFLHTDRQTSDTLDSTHDPTSPLFHVLLPYLLTASPPSSLTPLSHPQTPRRDSPSSTLSPPRSAASVAQAR